MNRRHQSPPPVMRDVALRSRALKKQKWRRSW
jgi:hypothetical protein